MIKRTGRTACKGVAIGKAKVMKDIENIKSMGGLADSVIVVKNITPDLAIFLKGVIGIIAETGGITSHIASISREMGIPCIINVSDATSLIRNNEIVKIDGNESIVYVWSE